MALSIDQIKFKANNAGNGLDECRIVNSGDALYCKAGVTTGLLMKDNQLQVVAVSWTNDVPTIGAKKGYISSDGDYHIWDATANSNAGADVTSLNSLRESVNSLNNNTKYNILFEDMTSHFIRMVNVPQSNITIAYGGFNANSTTGTLGTSSKNFSGILFLMNKTTKVMSHIECFGSRVLNYTVSQSGTYIFLGVGLTF